MEKEFHNENKININIYNLNGIIRNVQSTNIRSENNKNSDNYKDKDKDYKDIEKNSKILRAIFNFIEIVIEILLCLKRLF